MSVALAIIAQTLQIGYCLVLHGTLIEPIAYWPAASVIARIVPDFTRDAFNCVMQCLQFCSGRHLDCIHSLFHVVERFACIGQGLSHFD